MYIQTRHIERLGSELLGYEITQDWYNQNIKGKADKNLDIQNIEQKDEIFCKHSITEVNGAVEFINKCTNLGIPQGIVTNCNRKAAEKILNDLNISLPLTIGSECKNPKPYPDPYIQAKTKQFTIVFEDSPVGVQSAKASGANYVIGISETDDLKTHGANVCIKDFSLDIFEILKLIENSTDKHLEKECSRVLKAPVTLESRLLKGGYIANIQKVFCGDKVYVLKYENNSNPTFNKISRDLKLYEREYYFYENFNFPNIPKYYGTIYNNGEKQGIILEYLEAEFNPTIVDYPQIIKAIADVHKHPVQDYDLLKPIDFFRMGRIL